MDPEAIPFPEAAPRGGMPPLNAAMDVSRARLLLAERPGYSTDEIDRLTGGELIVEGHRLADAASHCDEDDGDGEDFLLQAAAHFVMEVERRRRRRAARMGADRDPEDAL